MTELEEAGRYDSAVMLLPPRLRARARELDRAGRAQAEELRLRAGMPLGVVLPRGERSLGGGAVTVRDIADLVEIATGASVHSAGATLKNGYISCPGGHRVGLGGSVYLSGGETAGFRAYSSAAVRIAREKRGIAEKLLPGLYRGGTFRSTLIAAPPGAGKTTLLREIVRKISSPGEPGGGLRVSLCDERGEIAAMEGGVPGLSVGAMTDVLDGCPKARAVMMVLRSLNPQVVAIDEITAPEDAGALTLAANCGAAVIATAHAGSVEELRRRPLYAGILRERIFENLVFIRRSGGDRSFELMRGGEIPC